MLGRSKWILWQWNKGIMETLTVGHYIMERIGLECDEGYWTSIGLGGNAY